MKSLHNIHQLFKLAVSQILLVASSYTHIIFDQHDIYL